MDSRDESTGETGENLIFFALSDPTRRHLLDHLHACDGQRLGELSDRFSVSRQAVSKHLGVLQDAGLVVGRPHGRHTVFCLNPAPIRLIQSAWIDKFLHYNVLCDVHVAATAHSSEVALPPGPAPRTGTPAEPCRRMAGTDDRSPGGIGEIALSWGMSPEQARRIEAAAAALTRDAHDADQRAAWLRHPCSAGG